MAVRPVKTQISLGISPVWSESSLCAQWVAKDPSFLHVDSEDSDETGRMPRLIWVIAGHTSILLGLSCRGSYRCFTGKINIMFHISLIENYNFSSSYGSPDALRAKLVPAALCSRVAQTQFWQYFWEGEGWIATFRLWCWLESLLLG